MDIEKTAKNLERRAFEVSRFETKEEAAEYLTGPPSASAAARPHSRWGVTKSSLTAIMRSTGTG